MLPRLLATSVLAGLVATPAAALPVDLTIGGTLPARAQLHEAYLDLPVVAEVRAAGYLTMVTREKALSPRTPSDRALAIVDAVGAEEAARNGVDRFVLRGLQARLTLGPSGARGARDARVDEVDARQALVLGWARALAAGDDRTLLTRRGTRLDQAGAVQLLEIAVRRAPAEQAHHVALALARAAAEPSGRKACAHALALHRAARQAGTQPIRQALADRLDALAAPLDRACKPKELEPFATPAQLPAPPPVDEEPEVVPADRPRPRVVGLAGGAHPFGVAFVLTAPVFKGWMADPTVTKLAARSRLDEIMLEKVLETDPTGDLTIAVMNASVLMQRISLRDNADVAYMAIVRKKKLLDAPPERQKGLKITELTGPEAMALGYAYALTGRGLQPPSSDGLARSATPQQLWAHGKGLIPANAVLGPIMVHAHQIDLEREADLCLPVKRVDALRFIVQRSQLPELARPPLLHALDTVEAQCQASKGPRSPGP